MTYLPSKQQGTFNGFVMTNNTLITMLSSPQTLTWDTLVSDMDSGVSAPLTTYTPTVAGWYKVHASSWFSSSDTGYLEIMKVMTSVATSALNQKYMDVSATVYLNGTTDSVYVQAYASVGDRSVSDGPNGVIFECYLLKEE